MILSSFGIGFDGVNIDTIRQESKRTKDRPGINVCNVLWCFSDVSLSLRGELGESGKPVDRYDLTIAGLA